MSDLNIYILVQRVEKVLQINSKVIQCMRIACAQLTIALYKWRYVYIYIQLLLLL